MKNPIIPRSRATQDALSCAAFFQQEDDLYANVSSCQFDSDCTAVHVGQNYFTSCTNGMLAVNSWSAVSYGYLIQFQDQYSSSCQRVAPTCGAVSATPKCSSAGYCTLSN